MCRESNMWWFGSLLWVLCSILLHFHTFDSDTLAFDVDVVPLAVIISIIYLYIYIACY